MSETGGRGRALYGIHEVAERTGLSPELIRAWERRYGLPGPDRTAGGFRRYDDEDVERLGLLKRLRDRGVRIAELAAAPLRELRLLASESGEAGPDGAASPTAADDPAPRLVERLIGAARVPDPSGLRAGLGAALALLPPWEAADGVIGPFLARLGEMEARGELPIAHGLLAAAAVREAVGSLSRTLGAWGSPRRALLAGAPGDAHDLGLLLLGLALGAAGWEVVHLGAGAPAEETARAVRALEPALVGLSFVRDRDGFEVFEAVRTVAAALPSGARLLVGGRAAIPGARAVEAAGGIPCARVRDGLEAAGR